MREKFKNQFFNREAIKNRVGELRGVKRNENQTFGIVFACIIMGFFVLNLLLPDKAFSDYENRMLQTFPDFSASSYLDGSFESNLENYSNDQFAFRSIFVKVKSSIDSAAGSVYSNGVWKARGGYLIEDTTVPTESRIDNALAAIGTFKAANPSLKMNFLLAPNAVSILDDKLPLSARPKDQNVYMDKMFDGLSSLGVGTIDVRETFEKNKNDTQLYYYTDHHWTSDGALLAFNQFRTQNGLDTSQDFTNYTVDNDFVGTLASKSGFVVNSADVLKVGMPAEDSSYKDSIIYYEDTKEKTSEFYNFDNLDKKDAYTVFGGSNHPVYTIKTPVSENRRLLLIKDSYANSMIPYLAQYYREIVVVDPRYYFDSIEDLIAIEQINEVLFLYNANTFFGDDALGLMLSE